MRAARRLRRRDCCSPTGRARCRWWPRPRNGPGCSSCSSCRPTRAPAWTASAPARRSPSPTCRPPAAGPGSPPPPPRSGSSAVHALPMRLRTDVIGALNLFDIDAGRLDEDQLRIGQALADIATIGLLQQRAIRRRDVLDRATADRAQQPRPDRTGQGSARRTSPRDRRRGVHRPARTPRPHATTGGSPSSPRRIVDGTEQIPLCTSQPNVSRGHQRVSRAATAEPRHPKHSPTRPAASLCRPYRPLPAPRMRIR